MRGRDRLGAGGCLGVLIFGERGETAAGWRRGSASERLASMCWKRQDLLRFGFLDENNR
jgi:hypothetical protein